MAKINWKNKCWVTTIYLVHDSKVLLTWNKNLQTWIPVGGHIDKGETPMDAVKREVAEETGFDFEFHGKTKKDSSGVQLIKMHRFQIEEVPHHGQHMNFIFFGKCNNPDKSVTHTDEEEKLRWFTKRELLDERGMLSNVRESSLKALEIVSQLSY